MLDLRMCDQILRSSINMFDLLGFDQQRFDWSNQTWFSF